METAPMPMAQGPRPPEHRTEARKDHSVRYIRAAGAVLLLTAVVSYLALEANRPDAATCAVINQMNKSLQLPASCSSGISAAWAAGLICAAILGAFLVLVPLRKRNGDR
jgi:hypothetical protein